MRKKKKMESIKETHWLRQASKLEVRAARKVFPRSKGCLYYVSRSQQFCSHEICICKQFSGSCHVQENDTSTFSTAHLDLNSFSSFFTLHFTAAAAPTITIFIRAAPNLSTLTWLMIVIYCLLTHYICFGSMMLSSGHYEVMTATKANTINNNHYVIFKPLNSLKRLYPSV